ncbi:hypothetical protein V502_04597 [Pseudogymnoascus sp. VKM F-4520 (FW-2644)]|nr:hypothetical protein V502_04597 [Pseudogymnoascus sp. VKM F-4520 (FW-2644)]
MEREIGRNEGTAKPSGWSAEGFHKQKPSINQSIAAPDNTAHDINRARTLDKELWSPGDQHMPVYLGPQRCALTAPLTLLFFRYGLVRSRCVALLVVQNSESTPLGVQDLTFSNLLNSIHHPFAGGRKSAPGSSADLPHVQ